MLRGKPGTPKSALWGKPGTFRLYLGIRGVHAGVLMTGEVWGLGGSFLGDSHWGNRRGTHHRGSCPGCSGGFILGGLTFEDFRGFMLGGLTHGDFRGFMLGGLTLGNFMPRGFQRVLA